MFMLNGELRQVGVGDVGAAGCGEHEEDDEVDKVRHQQVDLVHVPAAAGLLQKALHRRKHVGHHVEQVVDDGVDEVDDRGHGGVEDSARRHHRVEQHEAEAAARKKKSVARGLRFSAGLST